MQFREAKKYKLEYNFECRNTLLIISVLIDFFLHFLIHFYRALWLTTHQPVRKLSKYPLAWCNYKKKGQVWKRWNRSWIPKDMSKTTSMLLLKLVIHCCLISWTGDLNCLLFKLFNMTPHNFSMKMYDYLDTYLPVICTYLPYR